MNELATAIYSHYEVLENIFNSMAHLKNSPLRQEYADRMNELAQLTLSAECEMNTEEVRERFKYVMLGLRHPMRRDWEDDERR
jgi:hypothetical protein